MRRWLKRGMAEGIEGLKDRPMPSSPQKITEADKEPVFAVGLVVWISRIRCGPFNVWRITWPSKRVFELPTRPFVCF